MLLFLHFSEIFDIVNHYALKDYRRQHDIYPVPVVFVQLSLRMVLEDFCPTTWQLGGCRIYLHPRAVQDLHNVANESIQSIA